MTLNTCWKYSFWWWLVMLNLYYLSSYNFRCIQYLLTSATDVASRGFNFNSYRCDISYISNIRIISKIESVCMCIYIQKLFKKKLENVHANPYSLFLNLYKANSFIINSKSLRPRKKWCTECTFFIYVAYIQNKHFIDNR